MPHNCLRQFPSSSDAKNLLRHLIKTANSLWGKKKKLKGKKKKTESESPGKGLEKTALASALVILVITEVGDIVLRPWFSTAQGRDFSMAGLPLSTYTFNVVLAASQVTGSDI